MSDVSQVLQDAYEDRHEIIRTVPIERTYSQPVVLSTAPPLKMERAMVQLEQRLLNLLPDQKHNIIQFISCQREEGVSTLVQEFGRVVTANQSKSVLLVDGDYMKNSLHHAFGISPRTSLRHIMSNGGNLDQAITPVIHSRLFLALLSEISPGTDQQKVAISKRDLWVHIRKQFDMIIIDSTPITCSEDGLELCAAVDGVVMVVEAEKTRSFVISNLNERIVRNGGKLLGVVFNNQRHYIPEWLYKRL